MSGGKAVKMLSDTRAEFETGKANLIKEENDLQAAYDADKSVHVQTVNDLKSQENTLTVEKQTTEDAIEQNSNDKKDNENEVAAAKVYLGRLGQSCQPLLDNYDNRMKLRKEEEKSLKDAINVLENEA